MVHSIGQPVIVIDFNGHGQMTWQHLTERNVGRCIAIALNNLVLNAPKVNQAIYGGSVQITMGNTASMEQCQAMSIALKYSNLGVPVTVQKTAFRELQDFGGGNKALVIVFVIVFILAIGVQWLIARLSKT